MEDLAPCLTWALEEPETINKTLEVGGSEALTLRQVVAIIMEVTRQPRLIIPWGIPSLRLMTMSLEAAFPRFPASVFWLDYLSVNRTCPVDAIPRVFGLMPARFASRLDYLRGVKWGRKAWKRLLTRQKER